MSSKRKHTTLTLEDKWAIIQRHDRGESPAVLSGVYGIGRATVYDIVKNKPKIEQFMKSVVTKAGNRKTLKGGEFPKVEDALYAWFHQQREIHAPISGDILKAKARFFYNSIMNKDDFRASDGWLDKFKSRFGIRFLQMSGEKLSADTSEIGNFITKLEEKIQRDGLTPDQIYNADETGLNWRQLPTKSYVTHEEKSAPGRKVKKERLTLMPCMNASGSHKLKLLVVGKSKNPRSFKNFKKENMPVVYKNQNRAWVSREIFKEWYKENFVPPVKEFLKRNKIPIKALLLLDNAPGHPIDDEENMKVKTKDGFIEIMFLPKNTTALIQPLDQNVIKTMKMHYKKRLLMDIVSGTTNDISEVLKKFDIKGAVINSAYAWDQVSKSNILKSWKNVWPKHPLIEVEKDEPEADEDYLDTLSTACSFINTKLNSNEGLPREDLMKWLMEADMNADLSDDEIVEEMMTNSADDETRGDEIEEAASSSSFTVSCDDAVSAAATLIRYCQERDAEMDTIVRLKTIQQNVISDSFAKKKQKTLHDFFNV